MNRSILATYKNTDETKCNKDPAKNLADTVDKPSPDAGTIKAINSGVNI